MPSFLEDHHQAAFASERRKRIAPQGGIQAIENCHFLLLVSMEKHF